MEVMVFKLCILWKENERYMKKYHPMGEKAPRHFLCLATYEEINEGRGPCYVDCRHLSKKDMTHLKTNLLPIDKDTFMMYVEQNGLKLEKDMLELQIVHGGTAEGQRFP